MATFPRQETGRTCLVKVRGDRPNKEDADHRTWDVMKVQLGGWLKRSGRTDPALLAFDINDNPWFYGLA